MFAKCWVMMDCLVGMRVGRFRGWLHIKWEHMVSDSPFMDVSNPTNVRHATALFHRWKVLVNM